MQRMFIQLCALFILVVVPAFAQTESNAVTTASVAGRVTRSGEPVSNVSVFARRANQLGGWEQPGVSVKTDGNGQYAFSGLKAGAYSLSVRSFEDLLVIENSPRRAVDSGKSIVLKAGDSVTGMDFSLVKGGVISGTIMDENDKPVARTGITLLQLAVKHPNGQLAEFSPPHWYLINETDAQGRYRLVGLPAGKYLVRVGNDIAAPPARGKFYPFTFAPGTTEEAKAKIIEVTEGGEVTGINIKLHLPEPLYAAQGRIVDTTTGLPMAGVRIYYATLFSTGDPIRLLRSSRERTNAQGEFQLPGLRPGKHVACLRQEDAPDFYSEWTPFEVASDDVKGLEIKATRGGTIAGVVAIEGAKSQALPPDRSNLVVVFRDDSEVLPTPKGKLPHTNPDGSFRLTGLKPGNLRLHVNNANFAAPRVHLLRTEQNGQVLPANTVRIRSSENITNVRLVIGSGTGSVRGQLTFSGGALPTGEALSVLFLKLNGEEIQDRRPAAVDAAGRFFLEGLWPGEYRLHVNAPGTMPLTQTMRQRLWAAHSITVSADTETPVVLTYDLSEEKER